MRFRITNGTYRCTVCQPTYKQTVSLMNGVVGPPFQIQVGACYLEWWGLFQKYIEPTEFNRSWDQACDL